MEGEVRVLGLTKRLVGIEAVGVEHVEPGSQPARAHLGEQGRLVDDRASGRVHDDAGIGIISARTVIPFFAGFGWTGVICLKNGLGMGLAVLIAVAVGLVLMFAVYAIMRALWSLRETGTLDYHNAVGEIGTVYLPIPPKREGSGQVEVMVQGRRMNVTAFTDSETRLENRSRVRVVEDLGSNTLLVAPFTTENND